MATVVPSTVYADASGQLKTEPCYLIGGWHNSATNWIEFATEWKAFLKRHCICYLHQTGTKKTDYWKKDPELRERIKWEAVEIIERHGATSFVHFTPDADYRRFVSELPDDLGQLDPFVFNAFRFVVDVTGWCDDRHMAYPEFVFEAMDNPEQHAQLARVHRDYGLPEPIFRQKNAIDPARSIVALQAADFIAYEVFRGWKDLMKYGRSMRPHLMAFEGMPGRKNWAWSDYDKLKSLVPQSQVQLHLERIAKGEKTEPFDWNAWWAKR